MDDLPVSKKCCFCVPLRYGLLTWGYLKLAMALIVLGGFISFVVALSGFINGSFVFISTFSLVAVILLLEIIMHIVFIIAVDKKLVKVLKAYYNYALFMWTVTIIITIILISMSNMDIVLCLMFMFSTVVQTFLLQALRSEIFKLNSNCPHRFMKNDIPEGTAYSLTDDEEMSMENGTVRIVPGKKFNLKEVGTKL